jgi:hypothetical protein
VTRSKLLTVGGAGVLLVCAYAAAFVLPRGAFDLWTAFVFLIAIGILTFADVWLPGGDTVSVSAALVIGALLLMDVRTVLTLLLVTELGSRAAHHRGNWITQGIQETAVKAVSLATAAGSLAALRAQTPLLSAGAPSAQTYAYYLSIALLFAALEFGLTRTLSAVRSRQPIRAWLLGGMELGSWLVAAEASMGVLSALMFQTMGPWGIGVAVVLVLVTRQSFALFLQIRQAYQSTVDVLIKTMDAQQPGLVESAESLAEVSVSAGRVVGLHGSDLERLRYAALLYNVGLDEEPDIGDATTQVAYARSSSRIIEDVAFLAEVVPVLRMCEPDDAGHFDWDRSAALSAFIVMAADAALGGRHNDRLDTVERRLSPRVVEQVRRNVHRASDRGSGAVPDAETQSP